MPDLICYIPNHGYSDDDPIYVSWLDANYYVSDKDSDSFKLATVAAGSTLVQFTETITDGFVREIDDSAGTTTRAGTSRRTPPGASTSQRGGSPPPTTTSNCSPAPDFPATWLVSSLRNSQNPAKGGIRE